MKTSSLIELLARGAGPAPRAAIARRLWPAVGAGLVASALLATLTFGPIGAAMYATPVPWIKLAYAAALAAAGGWLSARLSRPVARVAAPLRAVLAVAGVMLLLGAVALAAVPDSARGAALLGQSWLACPWNVLGLSLPALAGTLWAMRGLAPTRLLSAGASAGVLAGAIGALGYALACTETSVAFIALWYTLGIGLTAMLGALFGPLVLRW